MRLILNCLNPKGESALVLSCFYGSFRTFRLLFDFEQEDNLKNTQKCLEFAIKGDNPSIFFYLFFVAQVKCSFYLGRSELHIVSIDGAYRILSILALFTYDLESKDDEGNTALMLALYNSV